MCQPQNAQEATMECNVEPMVVKIRFGRGPVVTQRQGKNSRIAMLAASLLTLGSISFASMGFWRLGSDLNWAGTFVFTDGLLSHWQVWLGVAAAVQYVAWRLTTYARAAREQDNQEAPAETVEPARATANL